MTKINLKFDYVEVKDNIDISITLSSTSILYKNTINLAEGIKDLEVNFDLESFTPQNLLLSISTTDIKITKVPVTINNIVLDSFYSTNNIIYSGKKCTDQKYKLYAKIKNIFIEDNVFDSNRLDFTGQLEYNLTWPFYRNIYNSIYS